MNRNAKVALFGAVFAVSVGMLGLNGVFSMPSATLGTATSSHGQEPLLGHLTIVEKDQNGNVKAYRQSDNVVTQVGRTCTAAALFGSAVQCANIGTYQFIGVGTNSVSETSSDTALFGLISKTTRTGYTLTNSTASIGGIASESALFTFAASSTVAESGLFDSTATPNTQSHMFARKAITPPIAVNNGDTVTVTWSITTG
jgi:hypothetical protein